MYIISLLLFSSLFGQSKPIEKLEIIESRADFFHLSPPAQESLSQKEIEERSLFHGEDLWSQFANMNTASSTNRTRYFKIRGIGERSEYDTIPSNSVGLFYDHIDLSGIGGILALYDVEKVEVLKGPQTFFYGDSALGGNVLLTSTESFESKGSLWGGSGSQNHRTFGTKNNYAVTESFSLKSGIQKNTSDGYFYNPNLQDHTSKRDELFANFGWIKEWGATLLKGSHILGENKNGNDFWNTDGSYTVLSDKLGKDHQLTHGHSLELTGPANASTHYIVIGSYSHTDQVVSYDEDWNSNNYWNTLPGWNQNYDYFRSFHRRKINLHLKSLIQHQFNGWDLSYGAHYYQKVEKTDVNSFRNSTLRTHLNADHVADKVALLTNLNYQLSKHSKVNFSNRFEHQEIQYSDTDNFNALKVNNPFAFNLYYTHFSGNHTWQAEVARGFKGAGFNPEINLSPEQQQYDPEYAMNYELSWKYQNTNLSNSLSLFYLDRRDHQITTSSQDDPADPSNFTLFVDNAARSHTYGLEWQNRWILNSIFSFNTSLGLMRAEFIDYQLRSQTYGGKELAHSPTYTFSVGTTVSFLSNLQLNMNIFGRDQFDYSNNHFQQSKPYEVLNSSLHWQALNQLDVSLWGRNLFNKRYSQRGFYFGNEPPNFDTRSYEQVAPPLEWGVRAEWSFL